MAQKIISIMLVIVGIIHLLPVVGVLGGERLSGLYGLALQEPNIAILMRHRAVLFGLLGLLLLYAAFNPVYYYLALIGGFTSVVSFLALVWSEGTYNEALQRVVVADIVALIALLLAAVLVIRG